MQVRTHGENRRAGTGRKASQAAPQLSYDLCRADAAVLKVRTQGCDLRADLENGFIASRQRADLAAPMLVQFSKPTGAKGSGQNAKRAGIDAKEALAY